MKKFLFKLLKALFTTVAMLLILVHLMGIPMSVAAFVIACTSLALHYQKS